MLTIDRFEGNWAICENENGQTVRISRNLLPKGCLEGDTLEEVQAKEDREDAAGKVYRKVDNSQRRKDMRAKMKNLYH
ncbi:hypothetical protein HNP82_002272 [Catenibacillus scindens]|uniref:DUF3006 domain-containing protein n=1 Tax=Catenibacillus scindens TaxID=673271 RepID=A0A7W8M5D4_9FIRM|nr:DUF3006 domain-containing protein [Catenibacillus scindens]MBB5265133.1 hypothetical protein [Catenibacillus scindens]